MIPTGDRQKNTAEEAERANDNDGGGEMMLARQAPKAIRRRVAHRTREAKAGAGLFCLALHLPRFFGLCFLASG